jgi:hypothetical protein
MMFDFCQTNLLMKKESDAGNVFCVLDSALGPLFISKRAFYFLIWDRGGRYRFEFGKGQQPREATAHHHYGINLTGQ